MNIFSSCLVGALLVSAAPPDATKVEMVRLELPKMESEKDNELFARLVKSCHPRYQLRLTSDEDNAFVLTGDRVASEGIRTLHDLLTGRALTTVQLGQTLRVKRRRAMEEGARRIELELRRKAAADEAAIP